MNLDPNDPLENLEIRIAKILRRGVIIAGLLVLAGWISHVSSHGGNPFAMFHDYRAESLRDSLQLSWTAHEWSLLTSYLGLLILISLPILRVLMTAILFFKQDDRVLAWVATFVFLAIIGSCLLGFEI